MADVRIKPTIKALKNSPPTTGGDGFTYISRKRKGRAYDWVRESGQTAPKSKPASKPASKRKTTTKKGCKQRKVSAYNMYQREVFKGFAKSISNPREAIKRAGKALATTASQNYYEQNKAKYQIQADTVNAKREICSKSRKAGYVKDKRRRKIENLSASDAKRLGIYKREKNKKMQWLYGKREMSDGTTEIFYVGGTIAKNTNARADKYYWSTLSPIKSRGCGDGKIRSRKTGKCVVKKKPCGDGKIRSRTTGRCQLKNKKKACPKGKRRSMATGRCRMTGGKKVKKECPKGTTRNAQTGRCRKNKVPAGVQPKTQTKDLNAMSTARSGDLVVKAGSLLM